MSEFREFKQETKSSLLDVDVLLQRAKSLAALPSEPIVRTREIPHITLDAIIRAIEQLSNHLGEYEILQQNGRNLHLQMETVQTKMERIIDQLEATLGCGSERLSQVQKAPHQDLSTLSNNGRADKGRLSVGEYLSQGRLLLESNQYEACLELMTLALTEHPGTEAIHDIARECRRRLADQQLQEEMFVYLENVKKEAIDQFDREQFQECVKTFAFLSELEPDNRVLKEYLKLSQQQVGETQGVALPNEVSAVQLTAMNTVPFREGIVSSAFSAAFSSEVSSDEDLRIADGNVEGQGKDTSQAKSLEETASDREPAKRRSSVLTNWKTLGVASYLIVLVLMLGIHKLLTTKASLGDSLIVHSEPPDSTVFVNGVLRGQTPLKLQSLEPGTYDIRIQKDGYVPHCSRIRLERNQPNVLSTGLETWPAQPPPLKTRVC